MKFTIVFPSHEGEDLSIGAVFTPCLAWMEGRQIIFIPHPEYPHYKGGDVQELIDHPSMKGRIAEDSRNVTLIVHPTGYGTAADLDGLLKDLRAEGFEAKVVKHSLTTGEP